MISGSYYVPNSNTGKQVKPTSMSNDINIGLSYLSMAIELQWSRVIVICIQLYMFDTLLPPFQIILFLIQFL